MQSPKIELLQKLQEVKKLRFQRNCKICKSDLATAILYLHHCENYSYKQLIDRYKPVIDINEYNLNCHFHRHVEQSDICEVEQTKLRWEKMKQEN